MPIELEWLIKGKVVLQHYKGDVSIEELQKATDELINLLNLHSEGKIHHLADFTQLTSFPPHIKNISDISSAVTKHPTLGWVIVYGIQNKLQKFIISTISQLVLKNTQVCNTHEEALTILRRIDATLQV